VDRSYKTSSAAEKEEEEDRAQCQAFSGKGA